MRHQVLPRDDLGPDEAFLDVAVDLSGRFIGRQVPGDRPGLDLFIADREKRGDVQEIVGRLQETGVAQLLQAVFPVPFSR